MKTFISIKEHDENTRAISTIRIALLLYFLLLIFEGAIRKWVLPGLAGPLLLVRDPVAIFILFMAWRYRLIAGQGYLMAIWVVCLLSFFATIIVGHGNMIVAIYGLRLYLLHLPLVFVIEKVYNKNDILKIVRWMLLLSIPMVVLIIWQFYSPQSAWINLGVGGDDAGSGFSGALGFFRPSGTFSFTNGLSIFFGMVAPLAMYALLNTARFPRWVAYAALISVLLSIPFSISRALFFQILLSFVFMAVVTIRHTRLLVPQIAAAVLVVFLYALSSSSEGLSTGLEVFESRFETASDTEGGMEGVVVDRFLGSSLGALQQAGDLPFFGKGMGMGTNAGSQLLTGERQYLVAEGEWGRVIGEMGALLGIALLLIRLLVSLRVASQGYRQIAAGNYLPWLLSSAVFLLFAQGQWGQPTSLGFSVFFTGLALAALKTEEELHA